MCHPTPSCFPGLILIKNIRDPTTGLVENFSIDQIGEAYEHPTLGESEDSGLIYTDFKSFINTQASEGIADDIELHVIYSAVRNTTIALDFRRGNETGHKIRESEYYKEKNIKVPHCGDGMIPYLSLAFWDDKKYPSGKPYVCSVKCFEGQQYLHADMCNRIDVIQYIYELLGVSCLDHRLKPLTSSLSEPVKVKSSP